ncbi:MAG: hypothetical protein K1X83_02300 [Oligoflexia bacterium]|nr:hypothetical protein [Oligoflexia bacterium]
MNAPARGAARNVSQVVSPSEHPQHELQRANIAVREHADPALLRGAKHSIDTERAPERRSITQLIDNILKEGMKRLSTAVRAGPTLVGHELPEGDVKLFHPMRNSRGDQINAQTLTGTLQGHVVDFKSVVPAGTRLELKGITPEGIVVGNTYRDGNAGSRHPILFCIDAKGKLVKSTENSYFAGPVDADYGADKQLQYSIARYAGIDRHGRIVAETSTNVPPESDGPTRHLVLKAQSPYL